MSSGPDQLRGGGSVFRLVPFILAAALLVFEAVPLGAAEVLHSTVVSGVQVVRLQKGELFAIVVDEGKAQAAGLTGVHKGRHLSITLKNDTFTIYMKREGCSFSAPAHGF